MIKIFCYYQYSCENFENGSKYSADTFIAYCSLLVAVVAIYLSCRYQLLTFINGQLLDIAKTCNSYLQEDYQVHNKESKITQGRASSILTGLEDAEKIINRYCSKSYLIWILNKNALKKPSIPISIQV